MADLGVADRMLGLGGRIADGGHGGHARPGITRRGADVAHAPGRVRSSTLAAAALLALFAAVAAYAIPERGNQRSAATAAQVRWELARTSVRMTAANPAFGIGIGRYSRSGEFSSPELLATFSGRPRKRAQQLPADSRRTGHRRIRRPDVAAVVCHRYGRQLLGADLRDSLRWGLMTGLLAFALVAGWASAAHRRARGRVWLLLGAAAGWGASLEPAERPRLRPWVVTAAVIAIAVSIPVRVDRQKADFNLEHRGVGLSAWHDAVDGVRYRVWALAAFFCLPTRRWLSFHFAPPARRQISTRARSRWPPRRCPHGARGSMALPAPGAAAR